MKRLLKNFRTPITGKQKRSVYFAALSGLFVAQVTNTKSEDEGKKKQHVMMDSAKEALDKAKHFIGAKKESAQAQLESGKQKGADTVASMAAGAQTTADSITPRLKEGVETVKEKSKDAAKKLENVASDTSQQHAREAQVHAKASERQQQMKDDIGKAQQQRYEQQHTADGRWEKEEDTLGSRRELRSRLYGAVNDELGPANASLKGQNPPGDSASLKKRILEGSSTLIQSFPATKDITLQLCDIMWYGHDVNRQVETHLYCSRMNDDFHQCVMYDENGNKPRMIGMKYIISEKLFSMLPDEEKRLWHSHKYDVESGILAIPRGLPMAENSLLKDLVNTYGKTFLTWQVDAGDSLPLGVPQLMMAFTDDGQVNANVLQKRDSHLSVDTVERRRQRLNTVHGHDILDGANAWETGEVFQISLAKLPVTTVTG